MRNRYIVKVLAVGLGVAAFAIYVTAENAVEVTASPAAAVASTQRRQADLPANDTVTKAVSLLEKGGADNLRQAYLLFKDAAEKGDPEGEHNLGVMYYDGNGIPKNREEAAAWFRKAAEKGHACSQYNLANMLVSGEDVAGDVPEARKWYALAADAGLGMASYNLGFMLLTGW